MREVDPTPRTSHVTPPLECTEYPGGSHRPLGACQVQRTAQCAWLRVRRETGVWHKAMPPPTPIPGEQPTCPGGAPPPLPSLPLKRLWGPGGVTPVLLPSGDQTACQHPLSFSSSDGVSSGSQGRLGWGTASVLRGVKAYVRLSPLPWSPLSVPSYPPRCGGGLVHPPFPTAHLRPPLPWHALYVLYYVYASACPVCGMGACGVCVVSECECSLWVGSVGLPRLVAGCASVRAWACPYQRLEKGGGHGL